MIDLIDYLLPRGRQLKTTAHPLVEITLAKQSERTQVHFVNLSGHSGTAYFQPAEMRDIVVELQNEFHNAKAMVAGMNLAVTEQGSIRQFTLPVLKSYEVVVLE